MVVIVNMTSSHFPPFPPIKWKKFFLKERAKRDGINCRNVEGMSSILEDIEGKKQKEGRSMECHKITDGSVKGTEITDKTFFVGVGENLPFARRAGRVWCAGFV